MRPFPSTFRSVCGALLALIPVSLRVEAATTDWILRHQRAGGYLWSVASNGRRLVAVGTEGRILVSDDGVVWNARDAGIRDWLVGVAYGDDRFVAVGDRGRILISQNGDSWTLATNVPTTARLNNVAMKFPGADTNRLIVAVGEAGTSVVSSDLGITWRAGTTGVSGWLRGLTYTLTRSYFYAPWGGGTSGLSSARSSYEFAFVACGAEGRILMSVDGLAWSNMDSGTTEDLEAVSNYSSYEFSSNGFASSALALGNNGVVLRYVAPSAEFVGDINTGYRGPLPVLPQYPAWKPASLGVESNVRLRGLANGGYIANEYRGFLVATGENGVVILERAIESTGVRQNLVGAVYHAGSFYIVGEDETILQRSVPVFPSRLGNLSTLGVGGSSMGDIVGGLVVTGASPKRVLVRAVGPGLSAFGVNDRMSQPVLTALDARGDAVATNSGWSDDATLAAAAVSVGAFPYQTGSKDAAMLLTLAPGTHTFHVNPVPGTPGGAVLFEAYDADLPSQRAGRLSNVSTIGFVASESAPLIAGFMVDGASSRTVLVRGIGPTLRHFGINDAVTDCSLTVYYGGTPLATNDDWGSTANSTQLAFVFQQVGAFGLDEGSKDAALILPNLLPGNYTVVLNAKGNARGRAMIEIYEMP